MRKFPLRAVALLILASLILSVQFPGRSLASAARESRAAQENRAAQQSQSAQENQEGLAERSLLENWAALGKRTILPVFAGQEAPSVLLQTGTPIFRHPVVPGAVISGYFDHQSAGGIVHHYNGRQNSPGAGFYFKCPSVYMNDWVGCEDVVAGEPGCANNREIWYDNHRGIDYEFAPNWHTGDTCNPGKFSGITMPIYAPARARVLMAGTDPNRWANGWHIRLQHDVNNNGNFDDDMLRSIYLHFTAGALAVSPGQIINEGAYLGLGGSTGYSSSPHLHFEVQRSSDYFQSTYWSVDPYGWQGPGRDPWPYNNVLLFRLNPPVEYSDFAYIPLIIHEENSCPGCGELLRNNGFESGATSWDEQEPELMENIIVNTSYPTLTIPPHNGNWLAWLGGRDNASDSINQSFTVPNGAKRAVLRYYLYLSTEESGSARDFFVIRLRTPGGNVIQELEFLDNTFADRNRWVLREINVPVESLQGQTLRMQIKGMTDAANKTNFYVDDLSLIVSE